MIPLFQLQQDSPDPLDHTSSLPLGLPLFFFVPLPPPFLTPPAAVSLDGSCSCGGLTGGVCCGSIQAKEQIFFIIFVMGLGARSLH